MNASPKAQALVIDTAAHTTIASGEPADWLKQAVLNLAEEVQA
ncbi:hypothetical protein [Deinococcus depolymerans]|uniref:Uncharacterized protein n=1 Tax=Deinococcus depolymerans TaxID=392408 RepID=A0ABN1BVC0_9DEIO